MRHLFKLPRKTSFLHFDGWFYSVACMTESPKNEQAKSEKNANKIIGHRIKQINAQAFRNRMIRGR